MEKLIAILIEGIGHGGSEAIFMLLISFIGFLIWDRIGLIKTLKHNSEVYRTDIHKVIDKYQEGQISVIGALNEIKLILIKIEARS